MKLFFFNLSATIAVSFIDHLLELFVGHALTQFLSNTFEILGTDIARLVVTEKPECLQDYNLGVAIKDLVSHHRSQLFRYHRRQRQRSSSTLSNR